MVSLAELLDDERRLRYKGGCGTCPRKRKEFVPATLSKADVILVGEAPGATEVEKQEGFTGASGMLLRNTLHAMGITEYALTNTTHCHPPKNATPTPKVISCCMSQYTQAEVLDYPIVVLVGSVAMRAFYPGITNIAKKLRGNLAYHHDFPGQMFYGLVHPAAVLRYKGVWEAEFERSIQRLARILEGDRQAPFRLVDINNAGFFAEAQAALDNNDKVSLDFETDRPRTYDPDLQIKSMAFCTSDRTAYFVPRESNAWGDAFAMVQRKLQQKDTVVIGHNIGYDAMLAEREGNFTIRVRRWLDTQTAYYLLKHAVKGWQMLSLKELQAREGDGYRHLVPEPHRCTDMVQLGWYNSEDVVYPYQLVHRAMQEMPPAKLDLFLRVYGPSCYVLSRCNHVGVNFDTDKWAKRADQLYAKRVATLEAWAKDDKEFAFGTAPRTKVSGAALDNYIFKTKQLPAITVTEAGKPQVTKGTITVWREQYGAHYLRHLETLRSVDKLLNTYVEPYEGHIASDGRVHPTYYNTTTLSGRTSCRDPNFQNQPRGKDIRDFFIPTPGWVLWQGDFSQIELRIAFSLANEQAGIAAYLRGADAHTETAEVIAELRQASKITKEDRTKAKPVNFGLLYGGGVSTLLSFAREKYGIEFSESDGQYIVRWYFNKYSGLSAWHTASLHDFRYNRGHVESVLGFSSYWADWDSDDQGARGHAERSALNMRVQGPAGHMCLYTLVLTDRLLTDHGMQSRVLGSVHDSIVGESPPDELGAALRVVNGEALPTCHKWVAPWFKVPLIMDFETGQALGSLRPYEVW